MFHFLYGCGVPLCVPFSVRLRTYNVSFEILPLDPTLFSLVTRRQWLKRTPSALVLSDNVCSPFPFALDSFSAGVPRAGRHDGLPWWDLGLNGFLIERVSSLFTCSISGFSSVSSPHFISTFS